MLLIIQLIYECTQALVRKKNLQHRTVLFKNGHEKMLTACKSIMIGIQSVLLETKLHVLHNINENNLF